MPRPLVLAILLPLLVPATVLADYRSGVRAWGHGDFATAAAAFLPAAQAGEPEAQYMMGRLYSLGDGVPRDFVQAWVWFDRAARQGHELAAEARQSMDQVLNAGQLAQARAQAVPPPPAAVPRPPPAVVATVPAAERPVVLVPRQSVAGAVPARLVAPGPTDEGRLAALGDLAERVRAVQHSLQVAGYYGGPLDGALGPATRQAIRAYQRDAGQPPTGRLTAQVVEELAAVDEQPSAR